MYALTGLTTIRYYTTLKLNTKQKPTNSRLTTIRYYTTLKRLNCGLTVDQV